VDTSSADISADLCHADLEIIISEMIAEVARIEAKYSRYLSDSIIAKINSTAGSGQEVHVDTETAQLLDYADSAFKQSAGLFDITSGVLRTAWNFKELTLPTQKELDAILPLIGWQEVMRSSKTEISATVLLPIPGMQLDFGGFGKEYAVDRAAAIGSKYANIAGLVNLGGDVRVFGKRVDENFKAAPFFIGIAHPRSANAVLATVKIEHGSASALATSGDYERFMEVAGKRYCHIINPRTGWPVTELSSVTVFSESCLIAGTLATITMLLGKKRGQRFLKDSNVKALLVEASSGKISQI